MKKYIVVMSAFFTLFLILFSPAKVNAQDDYTAVAETPPAAVGGETAIYKNVDYPEMAKKARVEGKVYVLVLINEKGDVDDAKLIKGIGMGCDDAALSAIKKAKFTPGKTGGSPVKAKLTMAINFKLK